MVRVHQIVRGKVQRNAPHNIKSFGDRQATSAFPHLRHKNVEKVLKTGLLKCKWPDKLLSKFRLSGC